MAKLKYYRFYLEDVTNGYVYTHIFSATSKAKAMELLSEYGSGFDVIAVKIVTPELMERYGLIEDPIEATPEETSESVEEKPEDVSEPIMAKIIKVEEEQYRHGEEVRISCIVYYESGRVREYLHGEVPKTVWAFIAEATVTGSFRDWNKTVFTHIIVDDEPAEPTPEQSENVPEHDVEEHTEEVSESEVKECKYCRECIYHEKCAENAPYRMECKSMYQLMCGCSACCEDFVSRKSIDDIYEEQKIVEN